MDPFIKNIKKLTKKFHVNELSEICEKCKSTCNAIHFRRNFKNWTSGNNDIDKFVQDTQLLEHTRYWVKDAIEWIPYDRLNTNTIKDKFDKVYRANWIDGNISLWNNIKQNWDRFNQNAPVILKRLDNSKNITLEFVNKVQFIYFLIKNFQVLNLLMYYIYRK
jgi:hypothetical protein